MPDIPYRAPRRLATARQRLTVAIDWVVANGGSAVLVGAVAAILWLLRVDLGYVIGGFIIVFASRLAGKRLYPEITMSAPSRTPIRDSLESPKDPMEALTR